MAVFLKEKRKFTRFPLRVPLKFNLGSSNLPRNTVSVDVSESGVKALANDFIKASSTVRLELDLNPSRLTFTGRIAWAQRVTHSDKYHIGLEFIQPLPETVANLRVFLQFKNKNERRFEFR